MRKARKVRQVRIVNQPIRAKLGSTQPADIFPVTCNRSYHRRKGSEMGKRKLVALPDDVQEINK